MVVAEKDIDLSAVEVNVREGVLFEPSYLAMNPFSVVPFLELDDGKADASVWLINDEGIEPFDWNGVPPWKLRP